MFNYISKRILLSLLTLFVILLVVYLITATFGPNPILSEEYQEIISKIAAQNKIGPSTYEITQRILEEEGFNNPPIVRFFIWFGNLFVGDLGKSYGTNIDLPDGIFAPLRWTLLLTVPFYVFSTSLGIILGTIAAYKRGGVIDTIINIITTALGSIPTLILIPIGMLFSTVVLGLPQYFIKPDDLLQKTFSDTLYSLIAPIVILTISSLSGYTILTRNKMVDVLSSNQVLIAKAKGLSTFAIYHKHVLRNIAVPLFGPIIYSFMALLSSSIIYERFFGVPGSANALLLATSNGDINVIMFNTLFFTGLGLIIQIFIEVMYGFIDPRIKISASSNAKVFLRLKTTFERRFGDKIKLKVWNNQRSKEEREK